METTEVDPQTTKTKKPKKSAEEKAAATEWRREKRQQALPLIAKKICMPTGPFSKELGLATSNLFNSIFEIKEAYNEGWRAVRGVPTPECDTTAPYTNWWYHKSTPWADVKEVPGFQQFSDYDYDDWKARVALRKKDAALRAEKAAQRRELKFSAKEVRVEPSPVQSPPPAVITDDKISKVLELAKAVQLLEDHNINVGSL